jgi:RND family efflux transporter MFP subunit
MRFLRRSLSGLFLFALTLGLLVYAGSLVREAVQARLSEEARTPPARERVFSVNVVRARFGTQTPELTAFGEVQSRRTLEIRAAAGGTVIERAPDFIEGGRVRAGQVLARIDPADAQAVLDRAKSDLMDAQAELREAESAIVLARDELSAAEDQVALRERALQRQADLLQRNVGTAAAVESAELALSSARQAVLTQRRAVATAEARIDQARSRVRRAEIARDEAQRRLDETEIRAAFGGTLSDVSAVAGRRVSANEQLARLVDPQALEVAFRVSTRQYGRLLDAEGALREAPVTVTLDMAESEIAARGTLTRDGAVVGDGQTGRLLFATLEQTAGFKPGDFVTVSIKEPPLAAVARLPATALDAADSVLVLDAENRLETAPVTLMRRQDDDVLVRGDALAGRLVVAERTPLLGAGIKVRPLRGPMQENGSAQENAEGSDMVALTEERRAALVAFIERSSRMPDEDKSRILAQLSQPMVPAAVIARIESRMGG